MKQSPLLPLFFYLIILSCNAQSEKNKQATAYISPQEIELCDSLGLDTTIIKTLREFTASPVESFRNFLANSYYGEMETGEDPVFLPGIVFKERNDKSYAIIEKMNDRISLKGYKTFLLEQHFNINDQPDILAIVKETNDYNILKAVGTNGINYDITTDSLLTIIKRLDSTYSLNLIGASGDYCEFIIEKEPADWQKLAEEVYAFCPDIVDQGTGSTEALAAEMKSFRKLYLWWD